MSHDIQSIKVEYIRLLNQDAKQAIIDLLAPLVHSRDDLSLNDKGWSFWNICDNYAMLRKPREQHAVQAEFYEWSKSSLPPLRQHWVVTDATQAMTLIDGGYLDFWWSCYQSANESAPRLLENRTVRFEAHRANAAAYTHFREFKHAETALEALNAVLSEDPLWVNRDFAQNTFNTLLLAFYHGQGQSEKANQCVTNLERDLDEWLPRYQEPVLPSEWPLLGSWAQLNYIHPKAVYVAVHNAACAMVVAKHFIEAEKLFETVLREDPAGMSAYSQSLYLSACWNIRHDRNEVRELFHRFQGLSIEQVFKFTSELRIVLGG
jgi:tetratricopeptide (TPR) repeat protein